MKRWPRTDAFEVGGLYFHVVPEKEAASGKAHKGRRHMVLEFWQPEGWLPDGRWNAAGRWIPLSMDIGFLIADFFCNEEDAMYERAAGNLGGDKYMRYCWDAYYKGWEHAAHNLKLDKEGKAERVSRPYRGSSSAWELHRDWSRKAKPHAAEHDLADDDLSANRGDGKP